MPCSGSALATTSYSQDEAVAGRTLPAWQSDDLFGGAPSTPRRSREPFVLNVWASWCPNCRAEHPLLGELASAVPLWPQLPGQGDAARAWLTEAGNPYRAVLADPDGRLALELGVYGTPETYLFAGDGTLLTRHTGELTRDIWQRQFAPACKGTQQHRQPARSGKRSRRERSAGEQAMSRLGHAPDSAALAGLEPRGPCQRGRHL